MCGKAIQEALQGLIMPGKQIGFIINEHYIRLALERFSQGPGTLVFWPAFEKTAKEYLYRQIEQHDLTFHDPPDMQQAILRTYEQCFDSRGRIRPSGLERNQDEYLAYVREHEGDVTEDEDSEEEEYTDTQYNDED